MAIQSGINTLIASILGASKLSKMGEGKKVDAISKPSEVLPEASTTLATQKDVARKDITTKQETKVQGGVKETQMGKSGFALQYDPTYYNAYAMYSMATNGAAQYKQRQKFKSHKDKIYNKRKLVSK